MAEAASDFLVLVAPDRRADDGRRLVAVTRRYVLIERHVGGVKMRIGVPISAFRGVALSPRETAGGRLHVVTLAHRDRDLTVELEAADDFASMAQRQQHWAAYLDVRVLAAAKTPSPKRRKRGSALRNRRPQVLSRRKTGDASRLATIFPPAAEISAYD